MSLKSVFEEGVESVFNVFNDAVKQGKYVVETDNGFSLATVIEHDVRIILDKFTQEDINSTLYPHIQPTDSKAMIPGKDLTVPMNTANTLIVDGRKFTVVMYETDPYEVLFTLLVRDTK